MGHPVFVMLFQLNPICSGLETLVILTPYRATILGFFDRNSTVSLIGQNHANINVNESRL